MAAAPRKAQEEELCEALHGDPALLTRPVKDVKDKWKLVPAFLQVRIRWEAVSVRLCHSLLLCCPGLPAPRCKRRQLPATPRPHVWQAIALCVACNPQF
jgi:hypothetical protein